MNSDNYIQKQKHYWEKSNLSTAVFYNNALNIDSNYVRSLQDVKELRAIAYYLQVKNKEIKKSIKCSSYFWTQLCFKKQVDKRIYELKYDYNKLKPETNE
jgi:hypothetical protein